MTPNPQSVCACPIIDPRQVVDGECLICGKPFEPSEPASLNAPINCLTGEGLLQEYSTNLLIAGGLHERAPVLYSSEDLKTEILRRLSLKPASQCTMCADGRHLECETGACRCCPSLNAPAGTEGQEPLVQKVIDWLKAAKEKCNAECGIYLTADHFQTLLDSLKLETPAAQVATSYIGSDQEREALEKKALWACAAPAPAEHQGVQPKTWSEYMEKYGREEYGLAEVTPKLEEIAPQIIKAVDGEPAACDYCGEVQSLTPTAHSFAQQCDKSPHGSHGYTITIGGPDRRPEKIAAILRPFITPASTGVPWDRETLEAMAEDGLLVSWDKDYKFNFRQVVRLMAEFAIVAQSSTEPFPMPPVYVMKEHISAPSVSRATPGEANGWPTAIEIHNRFCGHEGNICQACQLKDQAATPTESVREGQDFTELARNQLDAEYNAALKEYNSRDLHVGIFPSRRQWFAEKAVELKAELLASPSVPLLDVEKGTK